jgi:hypothetical protein
MRFDIDPDFLTDVTVTETYRPHADKEALTPDELIEVLAHASTVTSTCTRDHPEFAQLRDQLEVEGYIACERGWWNGDRVLRTFTLNSVMFHLDDQFPCAGAMRLHLKYKVKTSGSQTKNQASTTATDNL